MKRIVPFHVRVISLLIAACMSTLIVGIHAVDWTAPGTRTAPGAATVATCSDRSARSGTLTRSAATTRARWRAA